MVSVEGSGIAQNRRHDKSMGVWEGVKRGPVAKQDERFATEAELLKAGGGDREKFCKQVLKLSIVYKLERGRVSTYSVCINKMDRTKSDITLMNKISAQTLEQL